MLFELPFSMVSFLVDEKADPGGSFVSFCWETKAKNIFRWVMRSGRERIPPWLLDGEDVVIVNTRVV